jgi:methylated-DNA-[protein]-cysteine S-methyltransferase
MTTLWWSEAELSIGRVGLASSERGLARLFLPIELSGRDRRLLRAFGPVELRPDDGRNAEARAQVEAYLAGERRDFELPLDPRGTPFQLAVWRAVEQVGYGQTATYGQIAERVGQPRAVRAVGAANGDNPLPIVVPCHRIVGSAGELTGYGGGLPLKERLLGLEGALPRGEESWEAWAARRAAAQPSLLIGPRSTRVFCRPTCRYTRRLSRVPATFGSSDEARREGYRACRVCQPV